MVSSASKDRPVQKPQRPASEPQRLEALRHFETFVGAARQDLDDLVRLAAAICGTPMASVTLIDETQQHLVARLGLDEDSTPRDESFCAHAILDPGTVTVIPDAELDPRFHDNPLVTSGPRIRFYAGAPMLSADGYAMGALCVIDSQPREITDAQRDALHLLSRQASKVVQLRALAHRVGRFARDRDWYEQQLLEYQDALEAANADLQAQSPIDPLTGLANRRAFSSALQALHTAEDDACVAFIDIDHFKAVNDLHGHPAGDQVLKAIGEVLRQASDADGMLARYGGEEFAYLFRSRTPDTARDACERLRIAVERAATPVPVTVSIGVAQHRPGETCPELLERADEALYRAKRSGRNRVVAAH